MRMQAPDYTAGLDVHAVLLNQMPCHFLHVQAAYPAHAGWPLDCSPAPAEG